MPQAFVTVWDSFTNETPTAYVAIATDPAINYTPEDLAQVAHEAICEAGGEDPADWEIVEQHLYKEHRVLIVQMKNKDDAMPTIATYNVRFHF